MPDIPAYHRLPQTVKSTGGGTLKNPADNPLPRWEYREEHYFSDAAAEKRMNDMAEYIRRALGQVEPATPANPDSKITEVKLSTPLLPNDNKAGDGSRWDDI